MSRSGCAGISAGFMFWLWETPLKVSNIFDIIIDLDKKVEDASSLSLSKSGNGRLFRFAHWKTCAKQNRHAELKFQPSLLCSLFTNNLVKKKKTRILLSPGTQVNRYVLTCEHLQILSNISFITLTNLTWRSLECFICFYFCW